MKKFFNILYVRYTTECPKFFKLLIKIGLFCSLLGGGLKTQSDSLPPGVSNIAGYLLTAGICISVVSKFTVKDDTKLENLDAK